MSKQPKPRDVQVRHRLSGASLLGMREAMPPVVAVDAQPRAGDTYGATRPARAFVSEIGRPVLTPYPEEET